MSSFLLTFAKLHNSALFYQPMLGSTLETSLLFINNFDADMQQKSPSNFLVIDRLKNLPFWKCLDSNSPVKCKPISTEQRCNNTRDGHARCNCGPAGHVLSLTAATTKGFMAKAPKPFQ